MNTSTIQHFEEHGSSRIIQKLRGSILLATLCAVGLFFTACGDNTTGPTGGGGGGGGNGGGTTIGTEPTFDNVLAILETSCGGANCHIGQTTNGVRLDSYNNVTSSEGTVYGQLVVQPNDADGSPLVDKIEPNPNNGARMPQGGPYLSDSRIAQIREWINNGANNDTSDNSGTESDGGGY